MKIKTIILLISIFLLTGCYDRKELNKLAILTATEINKIDDEFIINTQIVNPQSPDKTTNVESPFFIYTGKGKTIQEAYRQIKLSSSRYIYPDHLRILIINEKLAKEDISQILDFYLRDPAIRTEFNILIGKTENILSPITPLEQISASSIIDSLEVNKNYLGVTNQTSLNELAIMYLNPHTEIILPSIKLNNDTKESDEEENTKNTKVNTMYELSGLGVFKNNKLQGYLTNDESITYNLIKNNTENSIITYNCGKDEYLAIEIITSKCKITTKNKTINIKIDINTTINESSCNINLNNQKTIIKLEESLKLYLNNKIKKDINNIRNDYNSDIFGFLDTIYKHDYKTYIEIKNNWYNNYFKNIPINIDTNINIVSIGNITEETNEKN